MFGNFVFKCILQAQFAEQILKMLRFYLLYYLIFVVP